MHVIMKCANDVRSLRSILVHLDGSAHAEARLRFAHHLAQLHDAVLTALFAVAPQYLPLLPLKGGTLTSRMAGRIDPGHRARAHELAVRARSWGDVEVEWLELNGEPVIPSFARRALSADLVVLGQRDSRDAAGFDVPGDMTEAVIIDGGRPALVVPFAGSATPAPKTVLVAWKSTPECARALTASLPFLRAAGKVHLVCANDNVDEAFPAPVELIPYLHLHGIDRVHEHRRLDDSGAGLAMLSLAAETEADLIVMGCYGHTRARELVLGGASRVVLDSMRVPVLMAH
ncbi:Universal stress protein family protein [Variovorax sp. PBS-H4]|uniref:universal stress protein n=1 Tax=Variovorax sp. PBS-H4 TaxID=434008 RepID=UPI00131696F3|nr:universal stress protein [Variovorax sp. PBS-H4]VTU36273.1 Universal stress protein family protein [Variovorax sp. PBS-H4]